MSLEIYILAKSYDFDTDYDIETHKEIDLTSDIIVQKLGGINLID